MSSNLKFHVSSDGKVRKCQAKTVDSCKATKTVLSEHFENKEDAEKAYEKLMSSKVISSHQKGNRKKDSSKNESTVNGEDQSNEETKGLSFKKVELNSLEKHFFNETQITGNINDVVLNENSYEIFGFKKPNNKIVNFKSINQNFLNDDLIYKQSKKELSHIDLVDKAFLYEYSGESYDSINEFMNLKGRGFLRKTDEKIVVENPRYKNGKNGKNKYIFNKKSYFGHEYMHEFTSRIDNVLSKGPGKQKIVYRKSNIKQLIKEGGLHNGMSVNDVIDSLAIGKEMSWNGYVSTSIDQRVIFDESTNDYNNETVIFEILTSEGVSIDSVSSYGDEAEVVLPRETKYRIVGKHTLLYRNRLKNVFETPVIQLVAVNKNGDILDGLNSDEREDVKEWYDNGKDQVLTEWDLQIRKLFDD